MATIIKGGKSEFFGHCKWCGCDFRYTEEDVLRTAEEVPCPHCKRRLQHFGEHGTSQVAPPMYGLQNAAFAMQANGQVR